MEERRRFVRLDTRLDVKCTVLPSAKTQRAVTKDVGGGGFCFLTDEVLNLTQVELCRVTALCGFTVLTDPEIRIEAVDCGGNVGSDAHRFAGSVFLRPGVCGN
jgi:hypothetical protein